MPGWEVRKGGAVYLLADPDDLVRMASIGQVRGGDEVRREGRKRWKKARDLKELDAVYAADPWAAWDTLGGRKPQELWAGCAQLIEPAHAPQTEEASVTPEPVEAPAAAPVAAPVAAPPSSELAQGFAEPVAPTEDTAPRMLPPPPVIPTPPVPAADLGQPLPKHPQETHPTLVPSQALESHPTLVPGEVIAFPSGARSDGNAAAALRLEIMASPETRDTGPRPRRMFPWVFGGLATVGTLAMLAVQSHVRTTATWVSPRRPVAEAEEGPGPLAEKEEPKVATVALEEPEEVVETPSALRDAADALRNTMSPGVIDMMGRPDDLSTALLVELSRMKLGPVKVQADVLAWGGAKNDMPEAAEIHVLLQSKGELEWELGAVGLVVGKYAQFYGLEVSRLQVSLQSEDGTLRRQEVDPELAREFYRNRIDLFGFLRGLL